MQKFICDVNTLNRNWHIIVMSIWGRMCVYIQISILNIRICTSSPCMWSRNIWNTIIYMLNRQQHTIDICTWHIIDNNKGQYILSSAKSRVGISISNMENNCMWKQYFMYKDSLYGWPRQRVFVHEVLFSHTIVLHIWNRNANSTFGTT